MEIIKVFVSNKENKLVKKLEFAISAWYAKPGILRCLAWYMNHSDVFRRDHLVDDGNCCYLKVICLTCTKYGCQQFEPVYSTTYPVYYLREGIYKKNLPWLEIGFNDYASQLSDYPDYMEIYCSVDEIPF